MTAELWSCHGVCCGNGITASWLLIVNNGEGRAGSGSHTAPQEVLHKLDIAP
jgi:hypothetical protein